MEILQLSQRKIEAWICGKKEIVVCVCLSVCLHVCLFVLIFQIGLEGPRKMTYFVLELLGGFLHGDERGKSSIFRFLTGIRLTPCK